MFELPLNNFKKSIYSLFQEKKEFFKSKRKIEFWMKQHHSTQSDYSIIDNPNIEQKKEIPFVVNVHGHFSCFEQSLTWIPVKFYEIEGYFNCSDNQLKNLDFDPYKVQGKFICYSNQLASLAGCPQLADSIDASYNLLKDLLGLPEEVNHLNVSKNQLTSLLYCPKIIHGDFICTNNFIKNFQFGPDIISGSANFKDNPIESLEYFPDIKKSVQIRSKILFEKMVAINCLQESETNAFFNKDPNFWKNLHIISHQKEKALRENQIILNSMENSSFILKENKKIKKI